MKQRAESYMNGWQSGYHNAKLAERKRIIKIIREQIDEPMLSQLLDEIREENK